MRKKTWLSLGENCFPQTFIQNNKDRISSLNTVFSWSYSNIDYVLHFEEVGYQELTKVENFIFDEAHNTQETVECKDCYPIKYQSQLYPNSLNHYKNKTKSFFFWHSDVLNSHKEQQKMFRRATRMNNFRDMDDLVLLYYHVGRDRQDLPHIRDSLEKLKDTYYPKARVVLLYHTLTKSNIELKRIFNQKDIVEFEIKIPVEEFTWRGEAANEFDKEIIDVAEGNKLGSSPE